MFRLERTRTIGQTRTTEVVYGITSLTRARADQLLALTRDHWGIENRRHHVRDETFGEDRCRVRTGSAPQLPAAVRDAAIHLFGGRRRGQQGGRDAAVRAPTPRNAPLDSYLTPT